MSDISVKGIIQNSLSTGFSSKASIGEFIDNSLGANATQVDIKLNNNNFTYWDNGEGMNKKHLRDAYIIANRSSEISTTKHGRFGVGGNYAMFYLTQLKSPTLTISKTKPCPEEKDNGFNQIIIDLPTVIREDKYVNAASGVTYEDRPIWDETAGNLETGTLHHFECDGKIAKEIKKGLESNEIINSYLYWFCVAYNEALKKGFKLFIHSNDIKFEAIPIDPLEWDKIPEINKKETIMEVWVYENNIVMLLEVNGVECFYELYNDRTGRKHSKLYSLDDINSLQEQTKNGIEETAQKIKGKKLPRYPEKNNFSKELYTHKCNITDRLVYHNDWPTLQSYVYKHIGQEVSKKSEDSDEELESICGDDESVGTYLKGENEKKKHQDTFNYMGGDYYTRNEKRIARFDTKKPQSGDKAKYPFYTNTKHEIKFTAEIDDEMGVLINKSELKLELIHLDILNILELQKKLFVDEQYKLYTTNLEKQRIHMEKEKQEVENKVISKKKPVVLEDDDDGLETGISYSNENEIVEKKQLNVNTTITNTNKKSQKENIKLSFNEEDDEEEEEEEEDDEEEEEDEEEEVEPKFKAVGPKNDTTITINKGKQIIKKWFDNGSKNVELDYILNEMIKKYQDRSAADQIELLLSEMSLIQKYNIIVKSIKIRYPNECDYDTKDMLFGAELWRSYIESFPQTL